MEVTNAPCTESTYNTTHRRS